MIQKIISWLLVLLTGVFSSFITFNYIDLQQQSFENELMGYLSEMTLEEKIGQMLMVSFHENQLEDYIINKKIGGYILFNNNIQSLESIQNITDKITSLGQEHHVSKPFISIDQEGGNVSRLDSLFYPFPGNMALGATNSLDLAYQQGELTGRMLKYLGINLNFAPVVDVNSDFRNPVIGLRAYGNDPNPVAEMAQSFIVGQRNEAVISSIKHFPGHGNVDQDSHLQLPINKYSIKEVRENDMKPFEVLIGKGVEMIMTAHIKVPVLDEDAPATLSTKIIQGELRNRLGYNGVIITDDIGSMKAITTLYPPEEAAIKAVEAGVDILLLVTSSTKINQTITGLLKAVEEGRISEKRIDESVFRILALKYRYGLFVDNSLEKENYEELLAETKKHGKAVSDAALTVINNKNSLFPFQEGIILFLVDSRRNYSDPITEISLPIEKLIEAYYENYRVINIRDYSLAGIKTLLPNFDRVIFLSEKGYLNPQIREVINDLKSNEKFILVSLAEPYEEIYIGEIHSHIAIYSHQMQAMISLLEGMKGLTPIDGINPVPVNTH
ncbi:glycoside hydrolase family 3 protein [Alkaliphilus transvaalensis]|uniref:glycoside hydrolase family 3 protein n=1 Tax=Alkaliphilus transvaalensis TaxID=114628 RepID=UPI0006847F5E|nr:glycoside hydrolase family 3 protein [Alkaliphilus transvaalensis]